MGFWEPESNAERGVGDSSSSPCLGWPGLPPPSAQFLGNRMDAGMVPEGREL